MKKILSMILALMMLLTASAALAEGMGVQVIGGPETETEPVSLDDFKLGAETEIDGWGILSADTFIIEEGFCVYKQGRDNYCDEYRAGNDAEFAIFYMNIVNTTTKEKNYLSDCAVKVVYDDLYEYGGWFYQLNYDNDTWKRTDEPWTTYSGKQNFMYGINEADVFSIKPMYEGHYVFGCTLPNAVIEGKAPLKMIITIDGNEITYNIRK